MQGPYVLLASMLRAWYCAENDYGRESNMYDAVQCDLCVSHKTRERKHLLDAENQILPSSAIRPSIRPSRIGAS